MLSKYFTKKIQTEKFNTYLNTLIKELKGKKVLIYGAGEGFEYLLDKYPFKSLNIVAISDKKFAQETTFQDIKAICPDNITSLDFDIVLVTNEYTPPIIKFLENDLNIKKSKIKTIFEDLIPEEREFFTYLEKYNFEKHLKKLSKKLKNKKIILYGAGSFFETINEYYDLSNLNIIGISDRKFMKSLKNKTFLNYTAIAPDEIKDANPDYVLVTTKFFIKVIEDLYYNTLKGTKIKIKPLTKKPLLTLINEIWS